MKNVKEKTEAKGPIPPYLSYKTLGTFLASMKIALPSRIDRSVMSSMSGTIQAQLIATLEYLGLINSEGVPTDKLAGYVHSEGSEKQRLLKDIIVSAYPFLFKEGFDIKRATYSLLQERFIKAGVGGDTIRKCISFFLQSAEEAGIELSPHFKKKSGPRPGSRRRPNPPSPNKNAPEFGDNSEPPRTDEVSIEKLLLSKFPSFDPGWPDDVKAKWFDGFGRLMDEFKK